MVQGDMEVTVATVRGSVAMYKTTAGGLRFDLSTAQDATSSFIESRDLDLGNPRVDKIVQRMFFEFIRREVSPALQFYIKYRNTLQDPLQIAGPFSLGTSTGSVVVRVPGAKYIRIRIEDPGIQEVWQLSALAIWGEFGISRAL
jgi:hypothetical protein